MSKAKFQIPEEGIQDARTLGGGRMLVLGIQHLFAMFGATVLVPALTGLPVSATLLFAGIGTLLMHLISKWKVPVFLGSSFAFLAGYWAIAPNGEPELLPYACFGVFCAGVLYCILSALFKAFGPRKVLKFVPPIVTGPIIISIGLCLASSAVNNCADCWWIAVVAIAIVVICNIWGKGMIKIIPILCGVVISYAIAGVAGKVDWSTVHDASWIGLPFLWKNTMFSIFNENMDAGLMVSAVATIVPLAIATIIEHIGDISAISSTTGKNFIADPGLHRTLLGDGVATSLAAMFGAPANTTYGENTGVLALTRVYDPRVIRIAAYFAIILAFCPKFACIVSAMPKATIGGVSLILYGMISAVGVRNVVENKVDFSKSRNIIIAALVLGLSLGITYSAAGGINIVVSSEVTISLSGLAVGALVGIIINAILPGKDYEFGKDLQGDTSVNFKV